MAGFTEYLTREGEAMLAKMVAGTKISFTKIVCGDGHLPTSQEPRNMTALVNIKTEIDIETVMLSGGNNVIINATLTNDAISESFYFREKGIYMSDGEKEVLGIYANSGDNAELIETLTSTYLKKKLKTFIRLSDADNINIELKKSDYASAPIIPEGVETMEEFLQSPEAETISQGDTIIINGIIYTFLGGDVTNIYNYSDSKKTEIISGEEELTTNEETGKTADALITKKIYKNVIRLNKAAEFVEKKIVFVDENTIKTEYADGRTTTTVMDETGESIMTTHYDEEGEVIKKRMVTITDEAITEKEEILQAEEDIITTGMDISISGETLVFNDINAAIEGETLFINA